jgi:hypothetical protein
MWLRGDLLDSTQPENGISDSQLPDGGALEVVSALPRLDERDLSLGV